MPFGGVPENTILHKLEETNMSEIRAAHPVRGRDADYRDYAIREIADRGPETPYLESDHTHQDPALSRSVLNLRYNGTRGGSASLPQHSEMFMGFTGNDPRGSDTQPRLNKLKEHSSARARNLESRMGHNEGHGGGVEGAALQEADRPWTGPAYERGRMDMFRRAQNNIKVFIAEKEGKEFGRNVAADKTYASRERSKQFTAGDDGIVTDRGVSSFRSHVGGESVVDNLDNKSTQHTSQSIRKQEAAPWLMATSDSELSVARYTPARKTRNQPHKGSHRHIIDSEGTDQNLGANLRQSVTGQTLLRQHLAQFLRQRMEEKHSYDHRAGQTMELGVSLQNFISHFTPQLARVSDAVALHHAQYPDQDFRPMDFIAETDQQIPGTLTVHADRTHPIRQQISSQPISSNARLSQVHSILCKMNGMEAISDQPNIKYKSHMEGVEGNPISLKEQQPLNGLFCPSPRSRVNGDGGVQNPAIATVSDKLEIHNYSSNKPGYRGGNQLGHSRRWATFPDGCNTGVPKKNKNPSYRGQSQLTKSISPGLPRHATFGFDTRAPENGKGGPGKKDIRVDRFSDQGEEMDSGQCYASDGFVQGV